VVKTAQKRPRPVDLSSWIPKADVVQETGISERSLERRIQARKLRVGYRTAPGRRPLPVLHPEDVAALRAEMVQRVVEEKDQNAVAPLPVQSPNGLGAALVAALSRPVPREHALFLTLKEASQHSGLSVAYLRREIDAGKLQAIRDVSVKVRRKDLDAL
jgi:hypothetical protein